MPRHVFTREEAQKGGKTRAAMADFAQHQSDAFEMLKAKRPDCWRYIAKTRVYPYMKAKEQGNNGHRDA